MMGIELEKYNSERDKIIKTIKFDDLVTIIKQDELEYQQLFDELKEIIYNNSKEFPINLLIQFEDNE